MSVDIFNILAVLGDPQVHVSPLSMHVLMLLQKFLFKLTYSRTYLNGLTETEFGATLLILEDYSDEKCESPNNDKSDHDMVSQCSSGPVCLPKK